jgi:outer membrane protein OmpA-like peptidoglycan-associated protein
MHSVVPFFTRFKEGIMLPQDQPVVLHKKPDDDRYDSLIGVLLSFAMLAGVWHYAVKPKAVHSVSSLPVDTAAVIAPQACAIPVAAEVVTPVINRPAAVVAEPVQVVINTAPSAVPVIKSAPIVLQTVKRIPAVVLKPKPVVITPPPAVIVAPKPVVIEPVAVAPAPPSPVIEPADPKIIVRESIEFGNGSARLPPVATPRLLEIVELLKNDTRHLKIVGHTDNIGHPDDNHILSLKRAKAVMRFLVNSGVPAEHLTVEGAGADFPLGDNATEAGRKQNRRIEITEQS